MEMKTENQYYKGFVAGYREGIKAAASGKIPNPEEFTVLDLPVKAVGFSTRACNGLEKAGCTYIGDVVNLSEHTITTMRKVGVTTAKEIAHWLDDHGICYSAWSMYL